MRRRACLGAALALLLAGAAFSARADAVATLRAFIRDVKSGSADFTQTVTSTDRAHKKVSSGRFDFQRPDRFRFDYKKPYEQLIVSDGNRVWIYDPDLNQATARPIAQALGATPAALLAGGSLDADFVLADAPPSDGLEWAIATPKVKDGPFQSIRIGFDNGTLARVDIVDSFGQRSLLVFARFDANAVVAPDRFRFTPPAGTDVIEQ
jgi:outer membrane lipoprotein carrier protein